MDTDSFRNTVNQIETEVAKVIVGQEAVTRYVLVAMLAGGHALLEGVPGLGKTMLVRTMADVLDLSFSRIQFTPDLMPADIVGTDVMEEAEDGRRTFRFQPGPVFANLILADEINRATPKTQSALLEAMQERTVTVARHSYSLEPPFFVLATQNPIEMEGTYPLPEAQVDRFLFKIDVGLPDSADLVEILARTTGKELPATDTVADGKDLVEMGELARQVPIASRTHCQSRGRLCGPSGDRHPPAGRHRAPDGQTVRALRLQPAWRAGAGAGGQDHGADRRPVQCRF